MRFMVMVKANKDSEAGQMPTAEQLAEMGKYNDELIKAGILLAADGLQASSKGVRVRFDGKKRTIVDGPFTETKELLAGYWMLQVKSREEVLEWVKRIPFRDGEVVEVRQVFEAADFAPEASPEEIAKEQKWRDEHEKPIRSR